jgi:GH43 family beta-xylosidase
MQSRSGLFMFVSVAAAPQLWAETSATHSTFVNPVYEGADPWVMRHGGFYYYCRSENDLAISIWKSDRLTDPGIKRTVWNCPEQGWNCAQLWAPELHYLAGKWYIYYAASDGRNENHRAGVLESVSEDPQGEYIDRGELYTGDRIESRAENRWAIDATPVTIGGRLHLIWSGWQDTRDVQYLYIARMENPYTVAGNRVKICANDTHLWERVGETEKERGLHEAPQVLHRDGRVLVVYSCSGSWEPTYKLGLLSLNEGDDPLDPASWRKHPEPVFAPTDKTFGVGHCSFVTSPDGKEDWIVYHAKMSRNHGWERAVCLQPFKWTSEGLPDFGKPVAPGESLPLPLGEARPRAGEQFADEFEAGNWDRWRYFGYSRYVGTKDGGLVLGGHPKRGLVNHYQSGEKVLVRDLEWADFTASVRLRFVQGTRDAGILFRVQEPAVGYDAQKGYFAGLIPGTKLVVLGKTDGRNWTEIARGEYPFDASKWHDLRVEAKGEQITVSVDGRQMLTATDSQYRSGLVGLRVVDTHAIFDSFRVQK